MPINLYHTGEFQQMTILYYENMPIQIYKKVEFMGVKIIQACFRDDIFLIFTKYIGFYISCKLSPKETGDKLHEMSKPIYMKCQSLFSQKKTNS